MPATQSLNVISQYDVGNVIRQDISDVIEMVSQEDTPYTSNIGRGKAEATYTEWNTDALAVANEDNAAIEGDDAISYSATVSGLVPNPFVVPVPMVPLDPRGPTTRMGDYTQIMRKVAGVTGTLQSINVIGGKKQMAREVMKMGRELKLDREKRLVGVKFAAAGSDTVARQMAGFGAWIRTNVSRGAGGTGPALSGGTQGYPSSSPGAGTPRAFTEALLKSVMQTAYTNGGKPTMLMVGPAQKVVASTALTGIALNRREIRGREKATIIGAADVYVSDFGDLSIVPNPFMRSSDAWLIDPDMAELVTMRPTSTVDLATTGDSIKKMIIWEGTHKINNEMAHGAIADLS
jgi:hypothetical protein